MMKFGDEYFMLTEDGFNLTSSSIKNEPYCDSLNQKLPFYQYFYNCDARVRVLVQEGLPNFMPLGT